MKLRKISALLLGAGICMQAYAEMQPPPALVNPPAILTNPLGTQQNPQQQGAPTDLNKSMEKVSYSLGVQLGQGLKLRGMNVNIETFIQGIRDGYNGAKLQMNEQEIRNTLVEYQQKMNQKMTEKMNAETDKNNQSSKMFLEKNKTAPGVVTTPSGLQYKVITQGNGAQPKDSDVIVVNYEGTTIDGKEFDSSYRRGQPMTAQLKYMIPGWVEALKLMKKGSTWMLYIPSNLAYGERGAPPVIGPNQTLIFKVELLDIKSV